MSINISQFSLVIEGYLRKLGRPVIVKKSDGSEVEIFAVVEQTWRKNKTKFEDVSSIIGRVGNDYFEFFGPASCDITTLTKDDLIIFDKKKYCFVKSDRVVVGGFIQYYTGVLKRVWEEDGNVFR